ncbi:methyl-accepting chemotaxis sensory transducer [Desulfonatronospira thiodismutans ASO3-1]|uniref:Methyl-accepting chemotaxis sensory transducer n=1 Tax=Desulfonatronospira thiodismutans ASO3-1 TaxID=555779 RepID=D6SQ34_9BACT|nr:methyl-accepting chemotaxis protein [Desulfonatronospira thiodismutans]EFI34860.1 methyl-accepting chemotaxis sensory transducer [Desulfonatronospira thiodismutans ASO3-1]
MKQLFNLRLRGKIILPLIIALAVLILIIYFLLGRQLAVVSNEFIQRLSENKQAEIQGAMTLATQESEAVSSLFTRMPEVQQAYRTALQGDIDDLRSPESQEGREMLRQDLSDMLDGFKETRDEDLMLHFHLPNGRSLVRIWRDKNAMVDGNWEDVSDDISEFRETVMHVNNTGTPAQGLEVGRGGFTLRNVLPVMGEERDQLGSVEMLIDFDPVVEAAAEGEGEHLLVYMNEDLLDIATRLQDESEYPVLDNRYVQVMGADDRDLERMISADILDTGRTELSVHQEGNYSVAAFPILDYSGDQVGVMAYVLDISREQAMISNLTYTLVGTMALLLLILAGITFYNTNRTILRPLNKITGFASQVSAGNLEQKLQVDSRDEMQDLGHSLQKMVDNLKEKISEAEEKKEQARQETEKAEQFRSEAEEALEQARKAKREGMLQAAGQIEEVVERMTSASDELSAQVEQSSRGAEQQKQRTGETATAMEEMNATVLEVAKNASSAAESSDQARTKALEGADVVKQSVQAINRVQQQAGEMKDSLAGLGKQSEQIGQIMNVIEDIADQTNLLALNAAIEAARAGDAGRGFAVVADEVRKLAEKTMKATKEVGEAISSIQSGADENIQGMDKVAQLVDESTGLANNSGEALKEIVALAEQAADQVRSIATASEEQSSASEEVNRSMEEISRISQETADVMQQSAQAISDLAQQAQELSELVNRLKEEE